MFSASQWGHRRMATGMTKAILSPNIREVEKTLLHVPRWMWRGGKAITVTTSLCATSHYYPRKRAGLPGRVPTGAQVGEAVPPAYAELIARRALEAMAADSELEGVA